MIDLNHLEHQKVNAKDDAVVKQAEISLATAFSSLADLVVANVRICRECALTAFSLHPTEERLKRLFELVALPTGSEVTNRERKNGSGLLASLEAVVGEPPPGSGGGPDGGGGGRTLGGCLEMTAIKQDDDASGSQAEDVDSGVELSGGSPAALAPALTSNGSASPVAAPANEEETAGLTYSQEAADSLGVSESVIKDLAVVVHSPRWEVLSWSKGWEELKPVCARYVTEKDEMRSVTKDLNYLKIDYTQFEVKIKTKILYFPLFNEINVIEIHFRIGLGRSETNIGVSRRATRTASRRRKTRDRTSWRNQKQKMRSFPPRRRRPVRRW